MLSDFFNIKHLFSKKNSSVSALILTIGESSFKEARQSLLDQSLPLEEIVVVENVSPFSEAFNQGAGRIKTPFFIQCDADMLLDANCVEILLSQMREKTAIVAGYLRDPLQGPTMGVKLYRTDLCQIFPHKNSLSCETEFKDALRKEGWQTANYAEDKKLCLGSHRSDLSDLGYLFERFKLLGAKVFLRKSAWDFTNRFLHLAKFEDKRIASLLTLALIRGLFLDLKNDELGVLKDSIEYEKFRTVLSQKVFTVVPDLSDCSSLKEVFERGFLHNAQKANGTASFQEIFTQLTLDISGKAAIFLMGLVSSLVDEANVEESHERSRFLAEYIEKKFNYHLSIL